MGAGQVTAATAPMVAGAVAQRFGLYMRQAREDGELVAIGLQRLEDGRQGKALAGRGGRPVLHHHAVGRVDHLQALARCGRFFRRPGAEDHGLQQRQRHRGAHAAQHGAAAHRLACDHHVSEVLLMENGTL